MRGGRANRLETGDVGADVPIHRNGEAYEIECATLTGYSIARATLDATTIRAVKPRDCPREAA